MDTTGLLVTGVLGPGYVTIHVTVRNRSKHPKSAPRFA